MFDTHVHTTFSTDSKMNIENALKSAKKRGVALILTEHMDIGYPNQGEFIFDTNKYFKSYSKFRGKNLLLGIEIGMKNDCIDESRIIVNSNPFDYVIGSIHLVDNLDLYYKDYYEGKSKKTAYLKYLNSMLENLKKFDFIDSLGHIDYICRYAKYDDSELYYDEFSDIIDEIFKILISSGKCIELNTRRLKNKSSIDPLLKIYKRYRELGGKYITIGSDAHDEKSIGGNFSIAKEMVSQCDLKIVYFKDREIKYMSSYC
jgi:histidinol-phosphatase (PHP family)